jgi:hypothetical protein
MRRMRKVTLGVLFLFPLLTFSAINAAASNGASNGPDDKGEPAEAAQPSHPDPPGQAKKAEKAESSTHEATASVAASATTSSTATQKAGSSSSGEQTTHPPGNNGTVKIDGMPWDNAPNNEPHPGCSLQIDFYNYEQGDLWAHGTLELWSPTLPPSGSAVMYEYNTFVGGDPNGGGTDWDGSVTYLHAYERAEAMGATPNKNQGYHVRLTVHVPAGSIGADTKYKMLWLNCETQGGATVTPTPGGEQVTPTPTTSAGGHHETPSPTGSGAVPGSTVTPRSSGSSGAVLGATVTPGASGLAFTGSDVLVPLIACIALLLAATAGLRLARKLDERVH